jgi:hypothetical protein
MGSISLERASHDGVQDEPVSSFALLSESESESGRSMTTGVGLLGFESLFGC